MDGDGATQRGGKARDGPGAARHAVQVAPACGTRALQGTRLRDNHRGSRWRCTPVACVTPHQWCTSCMPIGITACNTGIGPQAQAPAPMTGWTQEYIDGCLPWISISVVRL